jgi:alpha-tubulin suppressor-like RCC1 family protein
VSGLTNIVAVAAGTEFSLALDGSGAVWAWGTNAHGELGDGTTTNRLTPVRVSGLTNVVAVSAGGASGDHALALKADGTVWAWGGNGSGQLGDGTTTERHAPVPVVGLAAVVAVAAGGSHSLALRADGTVWAWGLNGSGQLGTNSTASSPTPVQVAGLTGATALAAGAYQSLAATPDATVWAWGSDGFGQLGDGVVPTPVSQSNVPVRTLAFGAVEPPGTVCPGSRILDTFGRNRCDGAGV